MLLLFSTMESDIRIQSLEIQEESHQVTWLCRPINVCLLQLCVIRGKTAFSMRQVRKKKHTLLKMPPMQLKTSVSAHICHTYTMIHGYWSWQCETRGSAGVKVHLLFCRGMCEPGQSSRVPPFISTLSLPFTLTHANEASVTVQSTSLTSPLSLLVSLNYLFVSLSPLWCFF